MNRPGSTARSESNRHIVRSFESFLESWTIQQRQYLDELLSATNGDPSEQVDLRDLIDRVLSHHHRYYDEKSRLVSQHNVLLLFNAPWLTRMERALLWLGDFKPGLAVQLALTSVNDLTEEQSQEMERLRVRVRVEEKALNDELASIQESVAAPPLFEAARRWSPEDSAVESIKAALEAAVASADLLRMRTAVTVMEILNPLQGVKFLAAAARLQLQLRSCGLQRDTNGMNNNNNNNIIVEID